MSLENGKYLIVSLNAESGHLDLAPYTVPIFPPIYFIVGSVKKNLNEAWKVTRTDNGTYTIYSTSHPRAAWFLRGTTILAAEQGADEFSIEPAGPGVFTIRVPNENQVATLQSSGAEQLHVEGQDGATAQLWSFVRLDDN